MDKDLLPSETFSKNSLYYSPTSVNEDLLQNKGGIWLWYAPRDILKLDQWWVVLQKLCNNGILVAIKSSTATDQEHCVFFCFTPDYENVVEVKRAADEIRKVIDFGHPLYYKIYLAHPETDRRELFLYVNTVKGEFYKKGTSFIQPSECYWKNVLYYHRTFFSNMEELKEKSGKWILNGFRDITEVDQTFLALQRLCSKGTISCVSSTTIANYRRPFIISCFTTDNKNVIEIKIAADEIRDLIDYENVMYYTTFEMLKNTEYTNLAKKSKFMHTVKGGFYGKDKYERWTKLVI